jgi:hypothetical protein
MESVTGARVLVVEDAEGIRVAVQAGPLESTRCFVGTPAIGGIDGR